jgi:hypothetical protein
MRITPSQGQKRPRAEKYSVVVLYKTLPEKQVRIWQKHKTFSEKHKTFALKTQNIPENPCCD